MNMSNEVKEMLGKMPFVPIATLESNGPHLIVVSKAIVIDDETIAFFGWRQGVTSRNLEKNGIIQIAVVSEARNKGYRLAGKGHIEKEGAISDRRALCGRDGSSHFLLQSSRMRSITRPILSIFSDVSAPK